VHPVTFFLQTSPVESIMGGSNYNQLPWTTGSGWQLADMKIHFGGSSSTYPAGHRTAYIRGMVFLKDQFIETLTFKMRINYNKDPTHATNKVYNPSKILEETYFDVSIATTDLDDSGVYFFQDPDDSTKRLEFATMIVELTSFTGPAMLNFDFVGTYYDFDTAVDGKHADNKPDDYNTLDIGKFIAKGMF
jgi:hypothetical protein